ncbi:MAG: hypothetical protein ACO3LN_12135, partial [bacterium]
PPANSEVVNIEKAVVTASKAIDSLEIFMYSSVALNSLTRFDTRDALGSVSSWLGVVRVYKAQPCSESKVWE